MQAQTQGLAFSPTLWIGTVPHRIDVFFKNNIQSLWHLQAHSLEDSNLESDVLMVSLIKHSMHELC